MPPRRFPHSLQQCHIKNHVCYTVIVLQSEYVEITAASTKQQIRPVRSIEMITGQNQQLRLLKLLNKLARLKQGDPQAVQERNERSINFTLTEMDGPEHRDIATLYNNGLIGSKSMMGNPANQWSTEGVYAYEITEDGEEYLNTHEHLLQVDKPAKQPAIGQRPRVFIIHGTDPNSYVSQVETICRQNGLEPVRMMEQPNRGMGLPDKLRNNMNDVDYYVAILTVDETTTDGEQRARVNAYTETVAAHHIRPERLAILREDQVEIPSNLQGLAYIQLEGQWSMKLLQEFKEAGFI